MDLIVNVNVPLDVIVVVMHVDAADRKEIIIGQAVIPFDYLLRAPAEPFDVFLGPPKKKPPKKYKITPSGSVQLQVMDTQGGIQSVQSFGASYVSPLTSYEIDDLISYRTPDPKDVHDGPPLTTEQLKWLGTAFSLNIPHSFLSKKEWILLPFRDMGMRTGPKFNDFLGTKPGHRSALCIERPLECANVSDAYLLLDIEEALQLTLTQLRRKDLFSKIRSQMLICYKRALSDVTNLEIFEFKILQKWLLKAIMFCFPSSVVYFGKLTPDRSALDINLFEADGMQMTSISLLPGQGFDFEFLDRHPPRSYSLHLTDDLKGRVLMSFKPFPNTRLPRLIIPFLAGDVSTGFFAMENLDTYAGGVNVPMNDELEVRKWLEEIGALFGQAMYDGKEKHALHMIENYIIGWASTPTGLVHQILECCMSVLQGCRMIDIWSVDTDFKIKNLAALWPEAPPVAGRLLTITGVTIKSKLTFVAVAKSTFKSMASLFSTKSKDVANVSAQDNGDDDVAEVETVSQSVAPSTKWLCGIRYNGMEHVHLATEIENENVDSDDPQRQFRVNETKIVITTERNVIVSMYEVDENLKILDEYCGTLSFQTFQEPSLKVSLASIRPSESPGYDAELTFSWPAGGEAIISVDKAPKNLKSFSLDIRRAKDLMKSDANPYCEVYWNSNLIGKTEVQKKTTVPVWNESFSALYKGEAAGFSIEVYDQTLTGKGSFLGRVNIPFDQLLTPTIAPVDLPLRHKIGVNAKKQKYVGGLLTVEFSPYIGEDMVGEEDEEEYEPKLVTIPRAVWTMESPTLMLKIESATGLAKANIFGGASDPFVVVFWSESEDPVHKTRTVENNLDPVWNEVFPMTLGVVLDRASTTIADFPSVYLEVWSRGTVGKGSFLGCCVIPPVQYFGHREGYYPLQPSPYLKESENKLAQGFISVNMKVTDNVSSLGQQKYFFSGPRSTLNHAVYAEVQILKARDLMPCNRIGGKSDPFVKVIFNDEIVGETAFKKNNLNPTWNDEKFLINLSKAGANVGDLVLEVWDKDFFGDGQFMGEYRIAADMVLHPNPISQEENLQNRPGQKKGKISGTIVFKLIQKSKIQRIDCPHRPVVEEKVVDKTLSPLDLVVIKDPDAEIKRQK